MSTYSIAVSGPSTQMAWLRALIHKMAITAQSTWVKARHLISGAAHLGRTAATATLAIIGTPGAYDAGANLIRTAITAGWRTSLRVVRWISQGITTLGRRTHAVVAGVSPVLAHRLTSVVLGNR